MKRGTLIWVAVLAGAITAGIVAYSNRPAARLRRQVDYWVYHHGWTDSWQSPWERKAQWDNAVRALGPQSLPLLIADAQRTEGSVSTTLHWLAEEGPEWLPPWVRRRPGHEYHRFIAILALGAYGSNACSATPALLRCLRDPSVRIQDAAVAALAWIGNSSPEVLAALERVKTNADPNLANLAKVALWRLQATNAVAAPSLQEALRTLSAWRSEAPEGATLLLGELGPSAKSFVPALMAGFTNCASGDFNQDFFIKRRIATAVWRIDGSTNAPLAVLDMLMHPPPTTEAPPWEIRRRFACDLTREFGDIPEFCHAIRLWLEYMPVEEGTPLASARSNALVRVERTLRSAATNTPPVGASAPAADK